MILVGGSDRLSAVYSLSVNKTGEGIIVLPISLYQPAAAETIVTLTPSGTAKPSTEDYGTGKNYTLSATTCVIAAGATAPAVSVTLTVYNNPLLSLDKLARISFSNDNGYPMSYNRADITIIDDARPNLIDITVAGTWSVGSGVCAADGVTDDRIPFQAALDYLKDNGGGVISIPDGRIVAIMPINYATIKLPCIQQVSICGDGGNRTSGIKCLVNDDNDWHFFTSSYTWAGPTYSWTHLVNDSPGLVFQNLTIDGNGPNQANWGFSAREQRFLILTDASPGVAYDQAGRVKFYFDNCHIKNSLSDGVSINRNSDVILYETDFTDCHRGGPVTLGGYAKVDFRNSNCYRVTTQIGTFMGFQHEYGGSPGYGATDAARERFEWTVNNVTAESTIDFSESTPGTGSTLTMNNVTQSKYGGWDLGLADGIVARLTDCELLNRAADAYDDFAGVMQWVTDVECVRVKFLVGTNRDDTWTMGASYRTNVGIPIQLSPGNNGIITFTDCEFDAASGYPNPPNEFGQQVSTCGIRLKSLTTGWTVNFINPTFAAKFANNIDIRSVFTGTVNISGGAGTWGAPIASTQYGTTWKSEHHISISGARTDPATDTYTLSIANLTLTEGKFIALSTSVGDVPQVINVGSNVVMPATVNHIITSPSDTLQNITITGGRTINAADDVPPTVNTHGFIDDIYHLTGGNNYICTDAAFQNSTLSENAGTWELVP